MPNKTFFWFFLPTGLAMILFIGLPIISTGIQSFYAQHDQVVKEVKKCDPFGCTVSIVVDQEKTSKIREEKPLGKFNGFGTYVDRNHLAIEAVSYTHLTLMLKQHLELWHMQLLTKRWLQMQLIKLFG